VAGDLIDISVAFTGTITVTPVFNLTTQLGSFSGAGGAVSSVFGQTGVVNIPVTTTDIVTPSNPSAGNTTWYTKGGALCALSPIGTESCTGSGGGGTPAVPYLQISGTSYGPFYQMTPPGLISSWAWVNQGSATSDHSNGSLSIIYPASAYDSMAGLYQAAPSTPYSILARITTTQTLNASNRAGVFFRESGTGKLIVFPIYACSSGGANAVGTLCVSVDKYTNPTTYAGSSYLGNVPSLLDAHQLWFKLLDDGTNLIFSLCSDNLSTAHCQTYLTVSRTDFMSSGPNEVGFYANAINSTYKVAVFLLDGTTGSS